MKNSYIAAFRSDTMDLMAYCYTQIKASVGFLEKFDAENIGMKKDEFWEKVKQHAEKNKIKADPNAFILNFGK